MTVVDWCQNAMIALLLAWVVLLALVFVQIARVNRLEERIGAQEDWAHERDPESFGIFGPELEPEPSARDCEEAGGFHVAVPGGGNVCQNCPAVLV